MNLLELRRRDYKTWKSGIKESSFASNVRTSLLCHMKPEIPQFE